MTVIFVGSNPSQNSTSITAFWHNTKSRTILNKWLEKILPTDGTVNLKFMNVSDSVTPKNRALTSAEIRNSLPSLKAKLDKSIGEEVKVVGLGNSAQKALTLLGVEHFTMPHPSGLNRQLNDKEYIKEKLRGLKDWLSTPES